MSENNCEIMTSKQMNVMGSLLTCGAVIYALLLPYVCYFWKTVVHDTDSQKTVYYFYVSALALIIFRVVEFSGFAHAFFDGKRVDNVGFQAFNYAEWAEINMGLALCVSMMLFGFQIQDVSKFYASTTKNEQVITKIMSEFNKKRIYNWIIVVVISVSCLVAVIWFNVLQT